MMLSKRRSRRVRSFKIPRRVRRKLGKPCGVWVWKICGLKSWFIVRCLCCIRGVRFWRPGCKIHDDFRYDCRNSTFISGYISKPKTPSLCSALFLPPSPPFSLQVYHQLVTSAAPTVPTAFLSDKPSLPATSSSIKHPNPANASSIVRA